jgi:two-component system, OmpR family, sensor kinase
MSASTTRFTSLASRLVLIGVIQLAALALTAAAIFFAQGSPHPPRPIEVITPEVHAQLESAGGDSLKLQELLLVIQEKRVEVSVYDTDLKLIASSAEPPLKVPRPTLRQRPSAVATENAIHIQNEGDPRLKGPPVVVSDFNIHQSVGYLVAVGIPAPSMTVAPVLILGIGLAILVLGALLTARWIVKPIDQLSLTARQLGTGNLSARTHFERNDEIGVLGRHIDEMAERIERLVAGERELLADVAHELRTPLARIRVAIDLASEGNALTAQHALNEIAVDATELISIIDDVFTASRLDVAAGNVPLRKSSVDPADLATAALDRIHTRHRDRKVQLDVTPGLPMIHVDPILFRRVIDNALDNAHKYTPDMNAAISLKVSEVPNGIAFQVTDLGVGISETDLPLVFKPFFRGDKSRTRETGGVGLGLTLAKRIVDAHDGTIEITSQLNAGTCVKITVPKATR